MPHANVLLSPYLCIPHCIYFRECLHPPSVWPLQSDLCGDASDWHWVHVWLCWGLHSTEKWLHLPGKRWGLGWQRFHTAECWKLSNSCTVGTITCANCTRQIWLCVSRYQYFHAFLPLLLASSNHVDPEPLVVLSTESGIFSFNTRLRAFHLVASGNSTVSALAYDTPNRVCQLRTHVASSLPGFILWWCSVNIDRMHLLISYKHFSHTCEVTYIATISLPNSTTYTGVVCGPRKQD